MVAESTRTTLSLGRMRSPQVAAGSPVIFAAIASTVLKEIAAISEARQVHACKLILSPCIVFSRPVFRVLSRGHARMTGAARTSTQISGALIP
jgi:hypothetical protein